jgi:hypothetical protein
MQIDFPDTTGSGRWGNEGVLEAKRDGVIAGVIYYRRRKLKRQLTNALMVTF